MQRHARRSFLRGVLGSGVLLLTACSTPPAPSPTAAPAKPTAQPAAAEPAKPTAQPAAAAPAKPTGQPAAAEPAKPTGQPAAAAPRAKAPSSTTPVTIEVWHTEPNDATVAAMNAIIGRFQQKYPNVTVSQAPQGWADMEKKLLAGIAAGTLPEISQAIQYVTPSLHAKELLLPVDDVVNAIGKDNIFPHVRDMQGLYPDNHWYGITHAWGADMWIYRGDLADKKNLKEPKTWDELREFVAALQDEAAGVAGLQLAGGPGFFLNEDYYMMVGQDGGHVWKGDGLPNWTSKESLTTLNFWKSLNPYQPKGWLTQSYVDTLSNVAKGNVAVVSAPGRAVGFIEQNAPEIASPDAFRAMKYRPVGPDNSKPVEQGMVTQLDGEHWVVYRQSKSPEWAIEFLKFFYERQNYLEYCNSVPLHLLPIDTRFFQDQEFLEFPLRKKWRPWLDVQSDHLSKKLAWPLLSTQESDARIPHIAEVANSGIIADMVYDVVDKGQTAEQAADRNQKRAEQLIKDLR